MLWHKKSAPSLVKVLLFEVNMEIILGAILVFGLLCIVCLLGGIIKNQELPRQEENWIIYNKFTGEILASEFVNPEDAEDWMENYFGDYNSYLSVRNDFVIKQGDFCPIQKIKAIDQIMANPYWLNIKETDYSPKTPYWKNRIAKYFETHRN